MPVCKNCHTRIDKFNQDRCPICGVEHPFEGMTSDTIEITTNIDTSGLDVEYHPKKKSTLLVYFITLGIFGVPFFYLCRKLHGIIWCLVNLSLLAVSIPLTIVFTTIHPALVVVMYVLILILVNSIVGLYFYNAPNLKDGRGEFLI